nr:polycomb group protein Psc-like isoform X1 [Megalopta genalis]
MSGPGKRTYLREVNPYLVCLLCRGYLIDATTVVECLHSFCRSCILKHLSTEAQCPSCKHVLNKAKPNIKADKALQEIVYKLVPGLYHKEMRKRREFYKKHPEHADFATPEQRGEDVSGRLIFAPEDAVSLSLEYLPPGADPLTILLSTNDDANTVNGLNNQTNNNTGSNNAGNHNTNTTSNRRYLQCPALVTIAHLKKFLALKYSVDMTRYTIEVCHRRAPLPEHWTLMDVAYIYAWKRNAPMRFFYRVALEEQRLEAPPHDRPSTPGLGASLPADAVVQNRINAENEQNEPERKAEIEQANNQEERRPLEAGNEAPSEKSRVSNEQRVAAEPKKVAIEPKKVAIEPKKVAVETKKPETKTEQPLSSATVSTTVTSTTISSSTTNTTTTTVTNTTPSSTSTNTEATKQIKTPIKILKNPDGRYEVLRSPSLNWGTKEPSTEPKSSSPEFSVVSIGSGQNSNGVKITLKQCPPSNVTPKKPKVISNVLLNCGQSEKESPSALVIQQIQRDREKQQAEKQEKQRRRVTFVERPAPPEKPVSNAVKILPKKPAEQQDKKQFLQGFQLTARETVAESLVDSKPPETTVSGSVVDAQSKGNATKKEDKKIDAATEDRIQNKNTVENAAGVNASGSVANASKRPATVAGISGNARVNANKQCSDVDARPFGYAKSSSVATVNANAGNAPAKVDVYTFSNDPPVVPAGAVKRKCPPGLPIFDIKRKKQQQVQTPKKQSPVATVPSPLPSPMPNNLKSPRKIATEHVVSAKRPANVIGEPGPSRAPAPSPKPQTNNPMLSSDTRNILDGCGLNIPASLSITLTAPKSPGSSGGFVEPSDSKDNRKNALGKVSPSITLNDRSVDPRVLKALKAGQIRMPAPAKPRQTKQPDREINQQRQTPSGKRKREQESRDILDLSGGKKMDMHPLRIPNPQPKMKAKSSVRDNMPNLSDQGQVVTLMGGHRYYRAPPGSLTPAAHRVSDCPLPTPTRTPVYAPGLSSPMSANRSSTNLSSVFPSLQSLYALSQAPNLQQFQMDARLRLPRPTEANSSGINTDNRSANNSLPGKSHLAAQCAPVKPARSSIAPLAVPISKQQQSGERSASTVCLNRTLANEVSKNVAFRSNEPLDSVDSGQQQLSVQTKYPATTETSNNRYSPRSTTSNSGSNEDKASVETIRDANTESNNDSKKDDTASRQTPNREAASPRVSSTASPSPPPGDSSTSNNNENAAGRGDSVTTGSNGIDNDVPAPSPKKSTTPAVEVSSSKSPASPDSSSVTIESSLSSKGCSTVEQGFPSPSEVTKSSSERSSKPENPVVDATTDTEKKSAFKQSDAKQLTSEMFQKRLLAAFPSNEWANNPIAAQHLGNFLKSLNASIKSDNKMEGIAAEKIEAQLACNDGATVRLNNEATSKTRPDVTERS